jgi:hypothetical protein
MMHETAGTEAWSMALIALYGLALWGLAVTGIAVLVAQVSHSHKRRPPGRPWI